MHWFSSGSKQTPEGLKKPKGHWRFCPWGAGDSPPGVPAPPHPWQRSELGLMSPDAMRAEKTGSALCTAYPRAARHLHVAQV